MPKRWNSVSGRAQINCKAPQIESDDSDLDVSCVKIIRKSPEQAVEKEHDGPVEGPTVKSVAEAREENGKRRMTQAERKAAKAAQVVKTVPLETSSPTMSKTERRRAAKARHEEDLLKVVSTSQEGSTSHAAQKCDDEEKDEDEEEEMVAQARRHVVRPRAKVQIAKKTKANRNRQQKKQVDEEEHQASRWSCLTCGEINKDSRTECNNCGEKKPQAPPKHPVEVECVLCERAACTEDDDPCAAKLQICTRHLHELTSREQRLQKWAMAFPGSANAFHALSSPHCKDWRKTFFQEVEKLDLLLKLMVEHGEDLDEEDFKDHTPLECALLELLASHRRFDKKIDKVLGKCSQAQKQKEHMCPCCIAKSMEDGLGAFNLAVLLAWHWREGRGDVMPEHEEICNTLADMADLMRNGELPEECSNEGESSENEVE